MKKLFSVALDGPSGAGKSTLAKALAEKLNCVYVDTGAIYRTLAYHFLMLGIGPKDTDGIRKFINDAQIQVEYMQGSQHMILNGQDVTDELRTPEISAATSVLASQPLVRDTLLEIQRSIAKRYSVVMDGRDIGTVVLPNADVKIFITADIAIRAERRYQELLESGQKITYEKVLSDMKARDERDLTRKVAPLKKAKDAISFENTGKTIDEACSELLALIEGRCK